MPDSQEHMPVSSWIYTKKNSFSQDLVSNTGYNAAAPHLTTFLTLSRFLTKVQEILKRTLYLYLHS